MDHSDFLRKFKELLSGNNNPVGDIEMTAGNFDDFGNLIKTDIPTVTTDLCEIGIYDNTLYFVTIIYSSSFNESIFNILKDFPNIKIYGFKNFNKTLYPTTNFIYKSIEQEILNDKFLQIQFNYAYDSVDPQDLLKEYQKVKGLLINSGLHIVNQLNKNF